MDSEDVGHLCRHPLSSLKVPSVEEGIFCKTLVRHPCEYRSAEDAELLQVAQQLPVLFGGFCKAEARVEYPVGDARTFWLLVATVRSLIW